MPPPTAATPAPTAAPAKFFPPRPQTARATSPSPRLHLHIHRIRLHHAYGGNTGGNTTNAASLMMAALGSCTHFDNTADQKKINIYVSEVTTTAAAYALSSFLSVSATSATVGAPPANASAMPSCAGTGSAMSCTAGGLQHAFANAANLSDAVRYDGTYPTGGAYAVAPSNSSSSVPQALLNTIGNILQSCTNSSGGTPCSTQTTFTNTPFDNVAYAYGIAIDSAQNVWGVINSAAGLYTYVLPNTNSGTTSAPAYNGTLVTTSSTATGESAGFGVAIDSSNNAWLPFDVKVAEVIPTTASGVITSIALTNPASGVASVPEYPEFDGGGTLWYPGYTSGGYVWNVPPQATAPVGLRPCYAPAGATACVTANAELAYARYVAIDSTGSVWVVGGTNGVVAQMIGTASPTWPQLSYGHPATEPQ